jgi:hypothetical protein
MSKADLYVKLAGGQQVVGGYSISPYNNGNMGTGTFTFNPLNGNYQYATNNGAVAIQVPTVDCAMDILIINSSSAGAITFGAGWFVGTTGEPFNTTTSNRFLLSIRRIAGIPTYLIKALQ